MASGSDSKDKDSRWYFTAEQLQNSPSRKTGVDADSELSQRQRAANLIQDMGQRLHVSQLCINTAIVYMHRFYAFHSFTHFHRNGIAAASLFLAAKVEEQPRKLEHVIGIAHKCLNLEPIDITKESYTEESQDLIFNENVLLQTLGFDVAIDHPHTHVVKTCHLVKASKDLAQTSYFMASNSLHLTTMCLQYRPTVVACFCIHLACKWSRWEIPQSTEGKHWFHYVDKTVTMDLLTQLTEEFLHIFDRCPSRLKSKMKSINASASLNDESMKSFNSVPGGSQPDYSQKLSQIPESTSSHHHRSHHSSHSHSQHHTKQAHTGASSSSHKHIQQGNQPSVNSGSGMIKSRNERPPTAVNQIPMFNNNGSSSKNVPAPGTQPNNINTGNSNRIPSTSSHNKSGHPMPSQSMHSNANRDLMAMNKGRVNQHVPGSVQSQKPDDRRHLSKDNIKPEHKLLQSNNMDGSKNNMKQQQQQQSSNSNYPPNSISEPMRNQQPSNVVQRQSQQGNIPPPPGYNQAIATRNQAHHQQQQQLQQQQDSLSAFHAQKSTTAIDSNFRYNDDSSRTSEPMEICTPPKQSKLSSIFSPEWKNTPPTIPAMPTNNNKRNNNNNNMNSNNSSSNTNSSNSLNIKSNKDHSSPSTKKQHHDKKLETPKKEKRFIGGGGGGGDQLTPTQQKVPNQIEKRTNSAKKITDTPSMPVMPTLPQLISPFDSVPSVLKPSNTTNKRLYPSEDIIQQEDGIDFRDTKMKKLDIHQLSPKMTMTNQNISSVFLSSNSNNNSNNSNNSNSNFDISDIKSSKLNYPVTVNGIETNPDLVSSLLKESLCNDSVPAKYTTNIVSGINSGLNQMVIPERSQTLDMDSFLSKLGKSELPPISSGGSGDMLNTITMSTGNLSIPVAGHPDIKSDVDSLGKLKSEKKKKKEKHKHKEKDKDKVKDKEEKKKHKKDKERHKDKEKKINDTNTDLNSGNNMSLQNPIKITIPKDKLNFSTSSSDVVTNMSGPTTGFKIKIPKDRIKTDISSGNNTINSSSNNNNSNSSLSTNQVHNSNSNNNNISNNNNSNMTNQMSMAPVVHQQSNSLKIKISKDMIESYNSSSHYNHHHHHYNQHNTETPMSGNYTSSHSSSSSSSSSNNINNNSNLSNNINNNNNNSSYNNNNSSSSSSSNNKKKDRDRDRSDKDKISSKSGSIGGGGGGGGSSSSSKNLLHNNSNINQQQQQQQQLQLQQQQQQQQLINVNNDYHNSNTGSSSSSNKHVNNNNNTNNANNNNNNNNNNNGGNSNHNGATSSGPTAPPTGRNSTTNPNKNNYNLNQASNYHHSSSMFHQQQQQQLLMQQQYQQQIQQQQQQQQQQNSGVNTMPLLNRMSSKDQTLLSHQQIGHNIINNNNNSNYFQTNNNKNNINSSSSSSNVK